MDDLLSRWHALWQRLGAPSISEPIFAELVRRYGEPHRAYHTLDHIQDCLHQFDQARDLAKHPDEVEIALWCHDVIYDPYATDNERQSATWAEEILNEGHIPVDVITRVQDLILATQHLAPPAGIDAALIGDIDLSSLGYSPAEFDRYDAAIRQEYHRVPAATYREARTQILEAFLARSAIYQTPYFYDRYEAQARQNLTRAIHNLHEFKSPSL